MTRSGCLSCFDSSLWDMMYARCDATKILGNRWVVYRLHRNVDRMKPQNTSIHFFCRTCCARLLNIARLTGGSSPNAVDDGAVLKGGGVAYPFVRISSTSPKLFSVAMGDVLLRFAELGLWLGNTSSVWLQVSTKQWCDAPARSVFV